MGFYDNQREKFIGLRNELTGDLGQGLFFNIPREFVLVQPELNFMEAIRGDAENYFHDNKIPFWNTGDSSY